MLHLGRLSNVRLEWKHISSLFWKKCFFNIDTRLICRQLPEHSVLVVHRPHRLETAAPIPGLWRNEGGPSRKCSGEIREIKFRSEILRFRQRKEPGKWIRFRNRFWNRFVERNQFPRLHFFGRVDRVGLDLSSGLNKLERLLPASLSSLVQWNTLAYWAH